MAVATFDSGLTIPLENTGGGPAPHQQQLEKITPGYRRSPEAFVHQPLDSDPQTLPGLFDAELRAVGGRAIAMAMSTAERVADGVSRVTYVATGPLVWAMDAVFGDKPWN